MNDVKNLNEFCLTSLTSYLIQQSMLVKCTFESFIFGIIYGLFFLKYDKKDLLYFSGRYTYDSWKAVALHILSIVLVCGTIVTIFIIVLPKMVHVTFLDYLSHTIGMILTGFAIVWVLPKIERNFNWIHYYDTKSLLDPNFKEYELLDKENL